MAKKTNPTVPNDRIHPSGISDKDWEITPDSVRKFINSRIYRKKPKNNFPTWFILLLNVLLIGVLTYFLNNKVVFRCVTPPLVSSLSAALILVVSIHFIWRYVQSAIPPSRTGGHTITFTILGLNLVFSRNVLVAILNELQPWKVPGYLIGILLGLLVLTGVFLNLRPESPFYNRGDPFVIQSFEVQRSGSELPEHLAPNEILKLKEGEKVIVEVILFGNTQVSCTWFIASSKDANKTGCSIAYQALTAGEPDSLSIFVKPECGSHQESASISIVVEP